MKSIYILLTRSRTMISRIIGAATHDSYTHSSIAFDDRLNPMYSFSRKYVYLPLPANISKENLGNSFYKVHHDIPYALYKVDVDDDTYYKVKTEVEHIYTQKKKYSFNVIGLVLCKLQIEWNRKNRYFCSQFVSEVLNKYNVINLDKSPCLVKPMDFASMPELTLIQDGMLPELKRQLEY